MNTVNYERAKRYAYKVIGDESLDLVHDAYIKWFDKTGKDLFDEDQALVVHVVKRVIQNRRAQNYTEHKHQKYKKVNLDISDEMVFEENDFVKFSTNDDPYQYLSYKDIKNKIEEHLTEQNLNVFRYMMKGYRIYEIAEEFGKSFHNIKWHVERIRKFYINLN